MTPGWKTIARCAKPLALFLLTTALLGAQPRRTRNLVLVTADGLRWQEVFRGAEPAWLEREDMGMKNAGAVRRRFAGRSAEERRRALMPFLWTRVAAEGVLFGNRDKGSEVVVRNRHRFSYPGYSEILVGRPQDDVIDSNDNRPNPSPTVLEVLRRELGLPPAKVALFASWETFTGIGAHQPGSVFINAGYQPIEFPGASDRLLALSRSQFELLTPWRSVRHDYCTFEMALEYLRTVKPRVLYIALGETDDWAHEKRYDRYLELTHYFDHCLRRLWETLESDAEFRGHTTLLVTVDHGRGGTAEDWPRHGADVEGAQFIWLAAFGPDTPAQGEAGPAPRLTQSDIAPTMLALLGIAPNKLTAAQGKPVPGIAGAGAARRR